MQEVFYSVLLFTAILLALALLILGVRARLLPKGDVTIRVNGEREVATAPGGRLLGTLADAGIFVPSACGGGGTCGQCRVRVLSGGGSLLPTEAVRNTTLLVGGGSWLANTERTFRCRSWPKGRIHPS